MSQIIISNDIQDYEDCRETVLRNQQGFPLGTIVDLEQHFIVADGRSKVAFVLDNGRKVFVEYTRLAKRKFIVSKQMVESHKISATSNLLPVREAIVDPYAIGKTFYRDGIYAGTVISRGTDDFGSFVLLSSGAKVRVANSESDEFFECGSDEFIDCSDDS